ncbi:hypothetical protein [Paenibacillus sp. MMS18-CY102]|uniref:hypothetical protein n=1 Tax=Paenibacillus sp. MMS18-CY102 TaxID=2682849 RepID=UPI001366486C|nr:hypothetical protein [Paenibacillus sp. MMS18-CY102]MWC26918.1 hypothetical protein [Paenibacillus sp. MMS18-CY102]
MKLLIHLWMIVLTVVLSAFVTIGSVVLIATLATGELFEIGWDTFVVAIAAPAGITAAVTLALGVPALLLILKLVRREGRWGCLLRTWLHILSGVLIVAVIAFLFGIKIGEWLEGIMLILMVIAALQGGAYYGVYLALHRFVNEDETAEQGQ